MAGHKGCQALIAGGPCGQPARYFDARVGTVCGAHRARCAGCGELVDDHATQGDPWHHGCWVAASFTIIAATASQAQDRQEDPAQSAPALVGAIGTWIRAWPATRQQLEQLLDMAPAASPGAASDAAAELLAMDAQMGRLARLLAQLRSQATRRGE